ncbi:MAG: hypothetical protein WC702_03990 [Patescibacteria group bacterium]|jgi:hypothetical protein
MKIELTTRMSVRVVTGDLSADVHLEDRRLKALIALAYKFKGECVTLVIDPMMEEEATSIIDSIAGLNGEGADQTINGRRLDVHELRVDCGNQRGIVVNPHNPRCDLLLLMSIAIKSEQLTVELPPTDTMAELVDRISVYPFPHKERVMPE